MAEGELSPTEQQVLREFFANQKRRLKGLDVKFRLQLPGDVMLKTRNLELVGKREVVAHITAEDLRSPQDLMRRLAPRYQVIFAAGGCSIPLDQTR